ncbi:hypothetical protein G6F55_002207 [Rhizopus delemar]|uniref:Uncharacterized protein n=2 Tax=Rhizopus TaxID=4842 RepID=A0A9P6Z6U7_9FUNG|nr:hypothetical protein G6F55_002207 [Rhizopus delemar]KAG1522392.1 hypothetical protein G6F52_005900 [Rhizopus delemar]KAG1545503.1 hypothetical protein G6F51_005429 [Rhizopus arrhizus]KAG1571902.1 hypothetical protein G6F50_004208 [Rhizopus delemar]KAG1628947.1 hypothetical protein G6F45_006566 [Rhizopus arrhizus]
MAINAQSIFAVTQKRDGNGNFARRYEEYWRNRSSQEANDIVVERQRTTMIRINEAACSAIEALSNNLNAQNVEVESESTEKPMQEVLSFSKDLCSDKVGELNIIDLSEPAVTSLMKKKFKVSVYEELINSISLKPAQLTLYAENLIDAMSKAAPSARALRKILKSHDTPNEIDPLLHADISYMEVTIRYFAHMGIDLILLKALGIRSYFETQKEHQLYTLYMLNQLFLSHNDILEFGWIENECCTTGKTKWDGISFLVGDQNVTTTLVEFSGGLKQTSNTKECKDVLKLYRNLLKILESIPSNIKKQAFCVRFYDEWMHFEHLVKINKDYIRNTVVSFQCPSNARLLVEYVKRIPMIFAWKEAIVTQALEFRQH